MFENERLRERINQLFSKIESQLKQILRERMLREGQGFSMDEKVLASIVLSYVEGRINRFVRSDFEIKPSEDLEQYWDLLRQQIA
ncbi:transcriptional regulator slmA [Vibrio ishigakensis]|uniref:Transcriptional regulator slmA n=1 Tax=Vibrio ishigakensis TaxID=1481914 RepID=A0A0B8PE25_9VIBR|nr:transcriptional regulator slmA [Vibrio ishigakensis]GAM69625.1 transcriptional regulator slmA [Vibrio sp. JCM 19236]